MVTIRNMWKNKTPGTKCDIYVRFIFALLACVALAQASILPSYPAAVPVVPNLPLVSNVPYPYGVVSPAVLPLRSGFNNGFGVYDQRFNAFPLGYGGVLGYNGLFNGAYYGLRK
ncbi:hypothetical protein CDAR_366101 [Caerostris darwini]|uniref:Uncharacterized protein n=1 Tax=Caerostris darwini TaxID=1538125 RepID=A0AAV4MQG5_9ARAC|nr:hypothetical protein CDAR_366101 [Caerostris darwini]